MLTEEEKQKLIELAKRCLGIPYKYGAEVEGTPEPEEIKEIDCSELVEYLYRKIGYKIPDGARYQFEKSIKIEGEVETGDLAFKKGKNGEINHVGMVVFDGHHLIIEAEGWWGKVVKTDLVKFCNPRPTASQFAGIRRPILEKLAGEGKTPLPTPK